MYPIGIRIAMKNILILFTLFVAPILFVVIVMLGMLYASSQVPDEIANDIPPVITETPTTPASSPSTCGDGICSRAERTENACTEDC